MKNIGLIIKPTIQHTELIFKELEVFKTDFSFTSLFPEDIQYPEFIRRSNNKVHIDLMLVFGGDGTILRALPYALEHQTPVLGFNMGTLGFLTDCKLTEVKQALNAIKKNIYSLESRMLLDVFVIRDNQKIGHYTGLNDCVIFKGEVSKLISITVYENHRYVYETRCDGIIASTPTGSTAYSLSAGGPIISPTMDALIITPLNPHILSIRPIVFSAKESIELVLKEDQPSTVLQIDGDNAIQLLPQDRIVVKSSSRRLDFLKLQHRTFFRILRKKLHMAKK